MGMAATSPEHVCHLFDSDESRAEAVASYLADGLRAGEHTIVIARSAHWASIAVRLEALGVPVNDEIRRGRLTVREAVSTLAQISPRGRLNHFAFNEVIGGALRGVSGRVRAFGEMVDILAERGELAEALELEELWNAAGEVIPLSLYCGYSAAHFVAAGTHRALRDICLAHTDVRRSPQDTLAGWILTTAHHAGGSALTH
jgi:MEDS: MEthanogen/methylotroph, DcmR Sensory domain